MDANRRSAVFGIFVEMHGFAFVIGFALFECLYVYDIARNDIRYKDDFAVRRFCNRNAFGSGVKDFDMAENSFVRIFSSHAAKISHYLFGFPKK